MKKLPEGYLFQQRRIADDRLKRKSRRSNKRRHAPKHYSGSYQIIDAPKTFFATPNDIEDVITFTRHLSKAVKVTIDFKNTQSISALGAVYLYSEISNIQRTSGKASVRIKIDTIKNRQVHLALKDTGLFELCNIRYPSRVGALPIIQGEDDSNLPEIVAYLMNIALFHEQLTTENQDFAERLVNKAIAEAMLNVKQHAYPDDDVDKLWWITAAIIEGILYIALCDRGVGIPYTLSRQNWFKKLQANLQPGVDDAKMIEKAMVYTRSSRKRYTGGGLSSLDIQQLVMDARDGQLTIISGMGYYRLDGNNQHEKAVKIGCNVDGTLIQWKIPLNPQLEANND